jgi:succinyl-diaminopimelate desuccinylase
MRGALVLLFDLDEHTGGFAGVRSYFERARTLRPSGVYIGYPGADRIVTGGRGFLRATVTVHGLAAHSGASRQRGVNAVARAARLVALLSKPGVAGARIGSFPLPPAVTVTAIHGGEGYSLVPDACAVYVDMRLTPRFGERAARALLRRIVAAADRAAPPAPKATIAWSPGWPAYRLGDDAPLVVALRDSARRHLGRTLPTGVAGPSNVGNYLATLRVPAVCGFGVDFRAIHAIDECVRIDSIAPAYLVYRDALRALLRM